MNRSNDDSAIRAQWRKSTRGIFRDTGAERLDLALAGRLRLVATDRKRERLLFLDLTDGGYWELGFDDWPDGGGGSACLKPVTIDYVRGAFTREAAISVDESGTFPGIDEDASAPGS